MRQCCGERRSGQRFSIWWRWRSWFRWNRHVQWRFRAIVCWIWFTKRFDARRWRWVIFGWYTNASFPAPFRCGKLFVWYTCVCNEMIFVMLANWIFRAWGGHNEQTKFYFQNYLLIRQTLNGYFITSLSIAPIKIVKRAVVMDGICIHISIQHSNFNVTRTTRFFSSSSL